MPVSPLEISEKVIKFINEHASEDVRRLAFTASETLGSEASFALDQIVGRQTARRKLPSWADVDGIVYPPHLSMEQCSSEQTARYKVKVMRMAMESVGCPLMNDASDGVSDTLMHPFCNDISGYQHTKGYVKDCDNGVFDATFVDITGGFGVDFSFLARQFRRAAYVERLPHLCEMAQHNLPLLGLSHAQIINKEMDTEDTKEFFRNVKGHCAVFIDPARRDKHGGRTYAIADCTPDILGFIDDLLQNTDVVMVKLSPMLDWHAAVESLPNVREVHIVSVNNECKELLFVLSLRYASPLRIHCINDEKAFVYESKSTAFPDETIASVDKPIATVDEPIAYASRTVAFDDGKAAVVGVETKENNVENDSQLQLNTSLHDGNGLGKALYIPNSSIMKAGCFTLLEQRFGVKQIAKSSHLFTGCDAITDFPGKKYRILAVSSMNKKEIKSTLQGVESANISCRNFPLTPEQLRKKLKLKDGGEHYIFATTTSDGKHVLIICAK